MSSPVDRLRDAIDAWCWDEARERLWHWRGAAEAASAAELARRHARVASRSARQALGEAVDLGLVRGGEHGALAAHLARAAAEVELAGARDALRIGRRAPVSVEGHAVEAGRAVTELARADAAGRRAAVGRAIEEAAGAAVGRLLDARASADGVAAEVLSAAPPHPDATPDAPALVALAAAVLERTADAASEAASALLAAAGRPRAPTWADLVRGARAPELDGLVPRRERWRRLAAGLAALGVDRDLGARVRAEDDHGGVDPRARLLAVEVPTDVRLALSPVELGVASELSACDALGRALAVALTSPGLPVELRRPLAGTVGRAFGTLLAQLLADPVFLRRVRGLGDRDRARLSRHAARVLLLEARMHAAAVLARAEAGTPRERMDAGGARLREALFVEVPPPLAALVVATPSAAAARLRGRLAGLAAAVALRDRFDEDWFRNPRSDEPLRAAAARGGGLSAESWCTDELGVDPAVAVDRLIEISA